jgi:hypothetical protein
LVALDIYDIRCSEAYISYISVSFGGFRFYQHTVLLSFRVCTNFKFYISIFSVSIERGFYVNYSRASLQWKKRVLLRYLMVVKDVKYKFLILRILILSHDLVLCVTSLTDNFSLPWHSRHLDRLKGIWQHGQGIRSRAYFQASLGAGHGGKLEEVCRHRTQAVTITCCRRQCCE